MTKTYGVLRTLLAAKFMIAGRCNWTLTGFLDERRALYTT